MDKKPIDLLTLDLDWFALDKDGHIAHLTSAGWGSVPRYFIEFPDKLCDLSSLFQAMPASTIPMLTSYPDLRYNWNDFKEMASKGLFSFDYQVYKGPYVLVAKPSIPLNSQTLPTEIQQTLEKVQVLELCFNEIAHFNPKDFLDCECS